MELLVRPIGFVRSPLVDKVDAPRQPSVETSAEGRIEILAEHADALSDLEGFERIWLLFWFDRATVAKEKVQPPRSTTKRGVFATRSPHRPNPIGMSAVRLASVEGLVLHVHDLDLLDGTPILDIKPYLAYADAFPDAKAGWLEAPDPLPSWDVSFEPAAEEALAWIAEKTGAAVRAKIEAALALGPQPHAYRRIRKDDGGLVLAVKEWRARFRVEDGPARRIVVERVASGYRPRELAQGTEPVHALHRDFVDRFG